MEKRLSHLPLSASVRKFIIDNESADENLLALKYKEVDGVPFGFIADQIKVRRKAKTKLPEFYNHDQIVYPPSVNLEQSSSELTSKFKTTLIASAKNGIDLSGGFGSDARWMSEKFETYSFVEPNAELLEIAKHNHQVLGCRNLTYYQITAEEFLHQSKVNFDFAYIDPSRRTSSSSKVVRLEGSEPDVIVLLPQLMQRAKQILIKTSPLLDIQAGLRLLRNVSKVIVVAVKNECKEVLFLIDNTGVNEPEIEAVNLTSSEFADASKFSFTVKEEYESETQLGHLSNYLFEPNAAVMKAGAFKLLTQRFAITKLQAHTHLYTADTFITGFPGRVFKIEALVKLDKKILRHHFPDGMANIITRNYPLSVQELSKKGSLKEGGEKYLIAFAGLSGKQLAVASRIQ